MTEGLKIKKEVQNMKKQTPFPYEFFVVTFLWSWLIWLPQVLVGFGIFPLEGAFFQKISIPITILAAFGPAVGAFYCLRKYEGKGAVASYLRSFLDFRLGWRAWWAPIIILGGSTYLAWVLPELWGEARIGMLLPSVWFFPPYLSIMILFGGGQEELGWRGFILDPMEERMGPWLGNLTLGIVWGGWHLPLFFIPGTSQNYMNFFGFLLLTIGYSWFFAWIRQLSGKRNLAGLIAHGWANAFVPFFPIIIMDKQAAQPRYWLWVSLTFVLGVVAMAIREKTQLKAVVKTDQTAPDSAGSF
jgi:hypothetical protein